MGTYGKYMDPIKLMDYTVMQAHALLGGGAVGLDATSSAVRGSKRGLDDQGKFPTKAEAWQWPGKGKGKHIADGPPTGS